MMQKKVMKELKKISNKNNLDFDVDYYSANEGTIHFRDGFTTRAILDFHFDKKDMSLSWKKYWEGYDTNPKKNSDSIISINIKDAQKIKAFLSNTSLKLDRVSKKYE